MSPRLEPYFIPITDHPGIRHIFKVPHLIEEGYNIYGERVRVRAAKG